MSQPIKKYDRPPSRTIDFIVILLLLGILVGTMVLEYQHIGDLAASVSCVKLAMLFIGKGLLWSTSVIVGVCVYFIARLCHQQRSKRNVLIMLVVTAVLISLLMNASWALDAQAYQLLDTLEGALSSPIAFSLRSAVNNLAFLSAMSSFLVVALCVLIMRRLIAIALARGCRTRCYSHGGTTR